MYFFYKFSEIKINKKNMNDINYLEQGDSCFVNKDTYDSRSIQEVPYDTRSNHEVQNETNIPNDLLKNLSQNSTLESQSLALDLEKELQKKEKTTNQNNNIVHEIIYYNNFLRNLNNSTPDEKENQTNLNNFNVPEIALQSSKTEASTKGKSFPLSERERAQEIYEKVEAYYGKEIPEFLIKYDYCFFKCILKRLDNYQNLKNFENLKNDENLLINDENLKNENLLINDENLKNENNLKKDENLKNENNLKKDENLKNENNFKTYQNFNYDENSKYGKKKGKSNPLPEQAEDIYSKLKLHYENKNEIVPHLFRKDGIRKKIKTHFFKWIKKNLDRKIKEATSEKKLKFKKLNQDTIKNINLKFNSDLLQKTVLEVYDKDCEKKDLIEILLKNSNKEISEFLKTPLYLLYNDYFYGNQYKKDFKKIQKKINYLIEEEETEEDKEFILLYLEIYEIFSENFVDYYMKTMPNKRSFPTNRRPIKNITEYENETNSKSKSEEEEEN
jgi:hypothetical protein